MEGGKVGGCVEVGVVDGEDVVGFEKFFVKEGDGVKGCL